MIELKSHLASVTLSQTMAAASSSYSEMGSQTVAGKIPAGSVPNHSPTPTFPCCSPGRRDAGAMAWMSREALASIATAAKKIGHTSDMLETINMMVEICSPPTPGEMELISAVKEVVSDKFNALRKIFSMKTEEQHSGKPAAYVGLEVYLEFLEGDIERTCENVLHIVQHHLLPFCSGEENVLPAQKEENVVLYTKWVGDINWILAIVSKVEDKELHVQSTLTAYKAASKAAESLSAAHPQRLAVNLTETAFYFDVMEWPELATALAKKALEKAGPELASLDEESRKKSAEIMGLMEDNLKLWKKPTSPKREDYSEFENDLSFSLASLSLEAGPSYTNGSPSALAPAPPPCSADYSENENNTSFRPASLEALVIPRSAGPPVAPSQFISPGDWAYDVHEGLSPMQIRSRKKAAQIRRGRMG